MQLQVGFDWHNGWAVGRLTTQCCLIIVEAECLTCCPSCQGQQLSIVDSHVVFRVSFSLLLSPVESRKRLQKRTSLVLSTHVDISTVHLTLVVQQNVELSNSKKNLQENHVECMK